jgi:hypothetical protein
MFLREPQALLYNINVTVVAKIIKIHILLSWLLHSGPKTPQGIDVVCFLQLSYHPCLAYHLVVLRYFCTKVCITEIWYE